MFRRARHKPDDELTATAQAQPPTAAEHESAAPALSDVPPDEAEAAAPPADAALAAEQAEAEAALARLEDRIGAFASYTIAADFLELRQVFEGTFERIKEEDWGKRTERRAEGWTLRHTLAHLEVVAHMYNQVIKAGLAGEPVVVPGLSERSDLKAASTAAIEARLGLPVAELTSSFLGALDEAARLAVPLAAEGLGRQVPVPFFGAVPTVAELFGCSLAHAGVVHGAQMALTRSRPIWIYFQPGMMRRQLTRFFHLFGLTYWPERGGDLHATFGFKIAGQGGGSWVVRVGPEGGAGKIGVARTTDVTFATSSADLFCKLMTYQTPIWRALALRRLRIGGNLRLARRLPELFGPS